MVKKIDSNSKVSSTKTTGIDSVSGVDASDEVVKVGSVQGATGIKEAKKTRVMTSAEREQIFKLVQEEADKLFEQGLIPKEKKNTVIKAVEMAIDSSIIDED